MKQENLRYIRTWFDSYINAFNDGTPNTALIILSKREHILSVMANCRVIAGELGWSGHECDIAEMAGLLHDIGRFSQYAEYGTFIDSDSINHGERGYEVVSGAGILDNLKQGYRRIILDVIRYHNNKKFSNIADPGSHPFIRLVRDCDRLDKFRVVGESIRNRSRESGSGTPLTMEKDGPVNPVIPEKIRRKETVSKKDIHSQLDYYLFQLSYAFDIDYRATYRHMLDGGILDLLMNAVPREQNIIDALELISEYLHNQSGDKKHR
ncbi:HD domain-containing protein [bacterium]|nr:HD domain-containing protein [bacterium]